VRWGVRLARWLDTRRELPGSLNSVLGALRLLGHDRLRDGQLDAVLAALRGESVLVVRPTGSGKSLCFQLPTLMRPGAALVLSPLKALMQDQIADLQGRKVPASFINSDITRKEKNARFFLWEHLGLKLLYCAPERFDSSKIVNPAEIDRLAKVKPNFLVVDEAHCVDRWGWDFRPAYGQIGKIRKRLGNPPVLAFTATAAPATQYRILESLGVPSAKRVLADIDRPNIALIRLQKTVDDIEERAKIVVALLNRVGEGHNLIFVPTVETGTRLRRTFAKLGCNFPFFHSKLDYLKRQEIFGRFTGLNSPPLQTVICTNAFGMGLDVPDIRVVVHWRHPESVEDYLQELGRAGRDGKRSIALLFTDGGKEARTLRGRARHGVADSGLSPEAAEKVLNRRYDDIAKMSEISLSSGCMRRGLLRYMGVEMSRGRRSLSRWILDLVLVRKASSERSWACCDACDGRLRESIRECGSGALEMR
jgi:ATP-dependent DNA helicase RecQ